MALEKNHQKSIKRQQPSKTLPLKNNKYNSVGISTDNISTARKFVEIFIP
jgi:hypothetical protein